MDDLDRNILAELLKDSKIKLPKLAKKLGVPSSTLHHRIKQLEAKGIIKKWTIEIDYKKLGYGIKALILVFVDVGELKKLGRTQEDIAKELKKVPNTEHVSIITGDADLSFIIRAKDMESLRRILLERVQSIPGIQKTKTFISLSP